jgi:fumarate hydratase subunit alpha
LDFRKIVEDAAVDLIKKSVIELPRDVKDAVRKAYMEEVTQEGRNELKAIINNIELAEKYKAPVCQDTGIILFYVSLGGGFKNFSFLPQALRNAVRRATSEVPLRPSVVHPLKRENTGDNTGVNVPYINWKLTSSDYLELTVMPKGAGSENMSSLAMLNPIEGLPALKKIVVETVVRAGAKPCPPIIVGVGIGGSADVALRLAKEALLRPIGQSHREDEIAGLEKELLEAINMTGIGPMGLGGKVTALGVNVEYAHCHAASLPVGVNIQCWAGRRATARIYENGEVEYLT